MLFTKTEKLPTGAAVRERVREARTEIDAAERRIAALRSEDAGLEAKSSALLGEALAAGTSPQAEVALLRERRTAIAAEIETLRARCTFLTTSANNTERSLRDAEIRDARRAAETARAGIAERLGRAEPMIRDLRALQHELRELAGVEREAFRDEQRLRDQVGDTSPIPISDVGADTPTNVVPNATHEALSTEFTLTRDERLEFALARLNSVRQSAKANSKQN